MTTVVTVTTTTTTMSKFPWKASSNSRFIIDYMGQPWFGIMDGIWTLFNQVSDGDADIYLTDRKNRGFNFIACTILEHYFCDNAPNNFYDVAPFTGALWTTPNETFFARIDDLIEKAAEYGITVLLYPLYLGYLTTEEGWDSEVAAASTANMQSWGTYIGNRYKNYWNIVWAVGCDQDAVANGIDAKVVAFANALKAADPNHLITPHNERDSIATDPTWSDTSWISLQNSYSNFLTTPELTDQSYDASPTLPTIQIEGRYEDTDLTPIQVRTQAWWTILCGSCAFEYGNGHLWAMGFDSQDWKAHLGSTGCTHMAHIGTLLRSIAWQNLVPDTSNTVLTVGYGTLGEADYAPCAITPDDTLALIYMPSNRTMTVDMSEFSGSVTCRWYDPTNGSFTADAASPHVNTGTHDFSRATANAAGDADWLLVLEAA